MLRRVAPFTTDESGQPISFPSLEPTSTFVVCRDEEVPPARPMESRQAVVRWIDECLLGDLRTLLLGIDRFHEKQPTARPLGGCNFLLAAGCFMTLEYFGQVYGQGKDATSAARRYVADFLSRVAGRYSEVFDVLWSCFRNGIVHGSWPQAACVRGDGASRIAVGANPCAAGEHLGPAMDYSGQSFVISSAKLFSDLQTSFDDHFQTWLLNDSDDGVLLRAAPRLLEINPRDTARVRQLMVIRRWSEASRRERGA